MSRAFVASVMMGLMVLSVWLLDRMYYRQNLREKSESIRLLQEKLSKCQSNQIVFEGKVKKSDLNVRQFLNLLKQDSCQVDTASIVAWWDNLKPKERRKYRKQSY